MKLKITITNDASSEIWYMDRYLAPSKYQCVKQYPCVSSDGVCLQDIEIKWNTISVERYHVHLIDSYAKSWAIQDSLNNKIMASIPDKFETTSDTVDSPARILANKICTMLNKDNKS
jgi:hypothetical protein